MFFIVEPSSPSEHRHSHSYQNQPFSNSRKTHLDMSTEDDDAGDELPPRRLSIKHRKKNAARISSSNDGEIIMEIGKCIENLQAEKNILKAKNARLTQDIRKLNALRLQQAGLEVEVKQIIEDIHKRHARTEGPHRFAAKEAKTVRKTAARIEEKRWAELKVAEGMLEPYVEVDEEGKIVLKQEHEDDAEKGRLFDAYSNARSFYESVHAATTRLRQSRMELLDLGDFVKKVERIAIGDVHIPRDREKTPPAGVRRQLQGRRNSFPLSTRDDDERGDG